MASKHQHKKNPRTPETSVAEARDASPEDVQQDDTLGLTPDEVDETKPTTRPDDEPPMLSSQGPVREVASDDGWPDPDVAADLTYVVPSPEDAVEEAPVEKVPLEVLDKAGALDSLLPSPTASHALDKVLAQPLDTAEREAQSLWEERFEAQINTFFDEAIARVPGFVDRHLRSFRRVMGRSISPKTGFGDVLIGMRNMMSGAVRAAGGKDFSTTTFTHDQLTEAFEREVVSPEELESLLTRLFSEFEDEQWDRLARAYLEERELDDHARERVTERVRERLMALMEREIAHDPLLAQAIRSGVKIGIPATLGFVLFGKLTGAGGFGAEAAGKIYKQQLNLYHRLLTRLGKFEIPSWLGAVGWASGVLGSLALGGVMEYALNSVRDIKGQYIRQLNTARYVLLYGDNPDEPSGQGLLHVVRGLERQFERVQDIAPLLQSSGEAAGEAS